jgi:tetratricopeptide (TPR) repeat protein
MKRVLLGLLCRLGAARQQAKQFAAAIAAYQKAVALRPDPASTYSVGGVYALEEDADRAFEWLHKARTARADMTAAEVDPNLASLRKDPRFKPLLPRPDDYKDPFVEPVRTLGKWTGDAANDNFGWGGPSSPRAVATSVCTRGAASPGLISATMKPLFCPRWDPTSDEGT